MSDIIANIYNNRFRQIYVPNFKSYHELTLAVQYIGQSKYFPTPLIIKYT